MNSNDKDVLKAAFTALKSISLGFQYTIRSLAQMSAEPLTDEKYKKIEYLLDASAEAMDYVVRIADNMAERFDLGPVMSVEEINMKAEERYQEKLKELEEIKALEKLYDM